MSDVGFDVHEQVARIVRAQEATRNFIAERDKLLAKARKLDCDPLARPGPGDRIRDRRPARHGCFHCGSEPLRTVGTVGR